MFDKRSLFIFIALFTAALFSTVCGAEDITALSQVYATEDNVDVFVAGEMNIDTLNCRVSNQTANIIEGGLLADKGVSVRTTLLLDISKSISETMQEQIIAYVNHLIENIGKNEQYRIITFGEKITVLQDFTADRYDLATSVRKIEFNDQKSKLYDAIYNTIPETQSLDGEPCYYRTIVVTDGVDEATGGITREELYLLLQSRAYPIDAIAVSDIKQDEPRKSLSALTRISGGRYFNLYGDADIPSFSECLKIDDIFWIRMEVPSILLDGSTRQFNISDGVNSIEFDFKVPMIDLPETEPITENAEISEITITEPKEIIDQTQDVSTESSLVPTESLNKNFLNLFGKYTVLIYVIVAAALLIIILLVTFLAIIRSKKKSAGDKNRSNIGTINPVNFYPTQNGQDKTEMLLDGGAFNSPVGGGAASISIRLRNKNNPDQIWEISLANAVVIGRENDSQVYLNEKSVSRHQCKLYIDTSGAPTAENLSSSNITKLNDEPLTTPAKIFEGCMLKCGRITLVIDSLYVSSHTNDENINRMTEYVNV